LHNVALAMAFAVEWRTLSTDERAHPEQDEALSALWHAMGNQGHALSKAFRIQFAMIDNAATPSKDQGGG
jgi:hypothetical protein